MLLNELDFKENILDQLAEEMCVAARTAPKARGIDLISVAIAKGDTVIKLADKMLEIQKKQNASESFIRDSNNIRNITHVVLIGTKFKVLGLKACSLCGYESCEEKPVEALCAINPLDLGIAIGSALSVAADHRVDNRIMFSIGRAAVELKLLDPDVEIAMGIPLSVTGKNPFFDRV